MSPKSPPDIDVFDIANWFLAKAKSEGKDLKHMKLQKLVYFAYGWYYAYHDQPLFPETIFAWRHGPVVANLYHQYKHFGKHPIKANVIEMPELEEPVLSILGEVWESYSPCTDLHLSSITHRPRSPWRTVYAGTVWSAEIPPAVIRDYYKTLINQYENGEN